MYTIRVGNVNEALYVACGALDKYGVMRESRNGRMIEMPMPVVTTYTRPLERVLFFEARDANPFFHFFEGLWMLAGRRDLEFPALFAANMRDYSDDGKYLQGAYGWRWRNQYKVDQLKELIALLRRDPNTRRAVLSMWTVADLVNQTSKDLPCNTHIYFSLRDGRLSMTVCCRSNDVMWGAYGANVVHMSMLLEYMAAMVGADVGEYHQISNSFHVYPDFGPWETVYNSMDTLGYASCPYVRQEVMPYTMIDDRDNWDRDLALFFEDPYSNGFTDRFFSRVAKPIFAAWHAWRKKDKDAAMTCMANVLATDWRLAGEQWLNRRKWGTRENPANLVSGSR